MKFLKDDEFIILMAHNDKRTQDRGDTYHVHTLEERVRMRQAGIQTAHEQPAWNAIEPSRGSYDFGYLDNIINLNRQAGMKSLIQIAGWRIPNWIPDSWRPWDQNGNVHKDILSLWNEEAQQYADNFYDLLIDKYQSYDDVQFFHGEYQGGEGAYPPDWCFFDPEALIDFKMLFGSDAIPEPNHPDTLEWYGSKVIEHFVRRAEPFYKAYGEVYNAQQFLMDTWTKGFGNFVQDKILNVFRTLWPKTNIVLMQYTYFDPTHKEDNAQFVKKLMDETKCEVIAEALFADGLRWTTGAAISKGFRGQILHPTIGSFSGGGLTDEIVGIIKNSHEEWMRSRNL